MNGERYPGYTPNISTNDTIVDLARSKSRPKNPPRFAKASSGYLKMYIYVYGTKERDSEKESQYRI